MKKKKLKIKKSNSENSNTLYISVIILLFPFILFQILILRGAIQIQPYLVIGSIRIYIYSIILLCTLFILLFLVDKFKKYDKNLKNLDVIDAALFCIIPSIVGARLYHIITDWNLYANNISEIFSIWDGGLGIFGAILGALFGMLIYSKFNKIHFFSLVNITAFLLPISQIIGRYGNLVNQEIYGPPTDLPWGVFIRPENRVAGYENFQFFHPAYLYEQIGCFILVIIQFYIFRKLKLKSNIFIGTWLIGYGLIRFTVEIFRLSDKIYYGLSFNQIVSLAIIITGTIYLIYKQNIKLKTKKL